MKKRVCQSPCGRLWVLVVIGVFLLELIVGGVFVIQRFNSSMAKPPVPVSLVSVEEMNFFGTSIDQSAIGFIDVRPGYVLHTAIINTARTFVAYSEIRPCLVHEYYDSLNEVPFAQRRAGCTVADGVVYAHFIKDINKNIISEVTKEQRADLLPSGLNIVPERFIYDQFVVFSWINLYATGSGGLPRYMTFLYDMHTGTFSPFATGASNALEMDDAKIMYVDVAGTDTPVLDEGADMLPQRIMYKYAGQNEVTLVSEPNTHYEILSYSADALVYVAMPFDPSTGKSVVEKNAAQIRVLPLYWGSPVME